MQPVWVMGAGSVGTYVGGRLAAAGAQVHFIGRARLGDAVAASGLRLTDFNGYRQHLERVFWYTAPPHITSPAQAPGLVLLCVKSAATAQAAAQLAAALPAGTLVLSLQNGVDNARVAQAAAPALRVRAGMVPFNVTERAPGHLHQGTSGHLAAQADPQLQPWLPLFAQAGLPLDLYPDLGAVQWAKLLLNLNNPVNALSGLPLRAQLLTRDWRCCTAALMAEGLRVLAAAGIQPAKLTPLPARLLPALMRLPTPLFRLLAARMLRIDDKARSSMADDLALGRPPEIDALCGAVVRLGARHGVPTPRNAALLKRLLAPSPQAITARQLRQELGA
jgi:2-dehydropantoate 2-reductase